MSLWLLFGILAAACAVSLGVFFLMHFVLKADALVIDSTRGAAIVGVVGTAFSVILAFVTLISLQNRNVAKTAAESEALAIGEAFRRTQELPGNRGLRLEGAMICYARAVVSDEWPRMQHGRARSPLVDYWNTAITLAGKQTPIVSVKDEAIYEDMLINGDKRNDGRRSRLFAASPSIPAPVWIVLGLTGFITLGLVLLFKHRAEPTAIQAILFVGVTLVVASGLTVVWILDHPFREGSGAIAPTEMQR